MLQINQHRKETRGKYNIIFILNVKKKKKIHRNDINILSVRKIRQTYVHFTVYNIWSVITEYCKIRFVYFSDQYSFVNTNFRFVKKNSCTGLPIIRFKKKKRYTEVNDYFFLYFLRGLPVFMCVMFLSLYSFNDLLMCLI